MSDDENPVLGRLFDLPGHLAQTGIGEYGDALWQATYETLYMTFWSFLLSFIAGIALGIFLFLTTPGSLFVNRIRSTWARQTVIGVNQVASIIVNILRSLPFVVLLIAIVPLTRLLVGTALGPTAALVPLTISIFPFFARVVESSLSEIDRGRLEAVEAMGIGLPRLVFGVLLPESRSALIAGSTLTLIATVGNTAVAGVIGSGGLGDFAIKYGYQRYNDGLMYATVVILIVLVQAIQIGGDLWLRSRAHKR